MGTTAAFCGPASIDKVEIAVRPRFPSREGTEHAHTRDTVPGCNGANRGEFLLAKPIQCLALPFSHCADSRETKFTWRPED